MTTNARFGAVIFATDHERLAGFYEAVTGLSVQLADNTVVVLHSDTHELVIHKLYEEPAPNNPPIPRQDSYIKLFFPVANLAATRERVAILGGQLEPADKEWSARGFRASEATDPEGNIIQFREDALG